MTSHSQREGWKFQVDWKLPAFQDLHRHFTIQAVRNLNKILIKSAKKRDLVALRETFLLTRDREGPLVLLLWLRTPHGAAGKVRAERGRHLGGRSGFLLFHCKVQRVIRANGKLLLEQMLVNFASLSGCCGGHLGLCGLPQHPWLQL